MREIAPVLAGEGTGTEETDRGWGIVLDTIEIQDVRVLSAEVFARLQAPYRAALQLESIRAEEQVAQEQARLAEARGKEEEENRLRRMEQEEGRLLRERRRAEAARERLAIELATAHARVTAELAEKRAVAELEAETTRLLRTAMVDLSESRLSEIMLTETMPRLAEAYRAAFGTVNLTQIQSAASGDKLPEVYGLVTSAIQQIVGAARGGPGKTA